METVADAFSLALLSDHLERLLEPAFLSRADVEIVLADDGGGEGEPCVEVVAAYSCLLAARSPFLHEHISSLPAGEKTRLALSELVPGGRHIGREALLAVLGYIYTGRFKVPPQECVDDACWHGKCRPAIDFVIESMYAASGFQIPELVSLCQRRLFEFVDIALDEDIIPIFHVASTCQLSSLLDQCIQRVATSTMNKYLGKQLTGDLYSKIKELCRRSSADELLDNEDSILTNRERTVRNIHEALDSDDVNHVGRLLKESAVTLDDAFAIHYAAANCKPKVFAELLKLDRANLNLKDGSGYTPLHMACMRQEPAIILSLLDRGASVLEWTPDGRDALTICKRLAKEKDYSKKLEKRQKRKKAYLCIDILEQELKRKWFTSHSICKEETIVTHLLDNMWLYYLESRVAIAKSLFPSEAMLAMRVAEADSTEDFTGTNKRKEVSPNENTTMQNKRFHLAKTVELGRRYFPNCSEVLDKLFLKESTDSACFKCGTSEDQQMKRTRYFELKEEVLKAFDKDKAAAAAATSTASSCSTSRLQIMVTLGGSPSQAEGATSDSANSSALPFGLSNQEPSTSGTPAGQVESQGSDVVEDKKSKTKLKSAVWKEIERVKIGDEWKGKCRWCKKLLSAPTKYGTNHLKRHLDSCQPRKVAKAGGDPI